MQFNLKFIEGIAKNYHYPKNGVVNKFLHNRVIERKQPDSYIPAYYGFFYELTKILKPKIVVELGTWQGTSAAHFAAGCKDTKVITVDHHSDPGDEENKIKTIQAVAAYPNITYCQGWSCDQLYNEEKDLHDQKGLNAFPKVKHELNGEKIDILFIDSWHRYDQAVKDWNAYKPLLAKGALIICDDIDIGNKGGGIENMVQFWDEMEGEKFLNTNLHRGLPQGYLKWT